ncbi:IucA/IucC family C-terminal-domain containing protein [Vibrio palustris]|uniref:Ferric iron reductase FhuF-like transporter n=1 Tax=Vibrio palustris TaxID=1918946 RepID=A0A1R4B4N4_9VIBR|nr:IucA/IucC family C-terminal-domain containing protein [Vibrio palustris]SJL83882.1 Ferric iron reductase FhuF-like transporter [Vibrio palustris]
MTEGHAQAQVSLLDSEWQRLGEFGLVDCSQLSPYSIDTEQLLDDECCLEILTRIQPQLGATDLKVTASLVIKRIAFLTLAPLLSGMAWYDKALDMRIENCVFEYPLIERLWQSRMPLKHCSVHPLGAHTHRVSWREAMLTHVFKGHLSLLVEQFHRLTRVPKAVLWENIAVRIFSIYERRILPILAKHNGADVAQADFAYLIDSDTTGIFGVGHNPITRYYYAIPISETGPTATRVRRTCCYYYKATQPAQYCGTCPLLGKKPSCRS